jgi:aspartate kinase
MGATVLHDEAVFPVREADIPIHILNTNSPGDPGTMIVTRRDSTASKIVGVAGRKGYSAIFTEKAMMNSEVGYGRRVLEILETRGISYEHAPTSIDTLSVIVHDEELAGKESLVIHDIQNMLRPDRIEIIRDLAMIATVGEGMIHKVGMAAILFGALSRVGINVRMIDQGASEINIIVGVASADYEKSIVALYEAFAD